MYIDTSTSIGKNGKTYKRILLRESFRENGKVKHRTVGNLSRCTPEEVEAIKLALKHKKNLSELVDVREDLNMTQGPSVGAVILLLSIAKELGIVKALGPSREGKLALWQIFARIIDQGSRLSAVRLAQWQAACDVLGLEAFNEDDLYSNLNWLCDNQERIENRLFRYTWGEDKPGLFLYDVTSSYLEGVDNDLGAWGYNRDKKCGKQQIVIGLLCDNLGRPLSIEVFPGNTSDTKTFGSQIKKVAERFGGGAVTFVGDRGMIKGPQIKELGEQADDFHYISALTKPEIERLLKEGMIRMSLFDEKLSEITKNDGERLILRRNPVRADEIEKSRKCKLQTLATAVEKYNVYLEEHPRAHVKVGQDRMGKKAEKLRIAGWTKIKHKGRKLILTIDEPALREAAKLDGCYILRTDLKPAQASKETIHSRYKDLAKVEHAFRTAKTGYLEMRPLYLRRESHTRGYALVVMLAYRIVQELANRWASFDCTVEEAVHQLSSLRAVKVALKGKKLYQKIPTPTPELQALIEAAGVTLPTYIPYSGVVVSTRKKLGGEG